MGHAPCHKKYFSRSAKKWAIPLMREDYVQIKSNEESRPYTVFEALTFLNRNPKYDPSRKTSFMDHLNNELRQFIEFLKPSHEEVALRKVMIERVKQLILSGLKEIRRQRMGTESGNDCSTNVSGKGSDLIGGGEIENGKEKVEDDKSVAEKNETASYEDTVNCFGSYETGLYLPGGDIDLTLFTKEKDALKKLQGYLCDSAFIFTKSVIFLSKARVPILRFMDICHFRYDLSLNQDSGTVHTKFVKKVLQQQPYIKDIALFLKYFLKSRGLNESKRGGLCSYAQLLMIISFLNLHPLVQRQMPITPNLSVLFMDLFLFYGQDFCYDKAKICSYGYKKKDNNNYLSIEDPTDNTHDVGSLSTNMNAIRDVFTHAYRIMSGVARERIGDKYIALSLWIKVSDGEIAWRENVSKFHKKVVIDKEI